MPETNNDKVIEVSTRLPSMLLDHFFMSMIAMAFFIPKMISIFADAFKMPDEQSTPNIIGGPLGYLGLLGFALYFCKDSLNGRSPAKRIMKLQVVDKTTGEAASPLKCLVRNLFCMIWPIEVLVSTFNTQQRIGDRIAGTKLIHYTTSTEKIPINIPKTIIAIAIAYILLLMMVLPFNNLISAIEEPPIQYSETSYNPIESQILEKLLSDSLGQYITPKVKIYDTITDSELKYIAVMLILKGTYLDDEIKFQELHTLIKELIYTHITKETFIGRLKYTFQSSGHMQSREIRIGEISSKRKHQHLDFD